MKYITINDIARELRLSKSTVSRALSGDTTNVNAETARIIQQTAERMGYRRNELAVNLRRRSTHTVGIIIPEIVTSFFMTFISHAQRILYDDGYQTLIAVANESAEKERECLSMMELCRVDGILMSVCHNEANAELYRKMMDRGTPIVFFDRTVEGIGASSVRMDDYIMSLFMVEALIRQGRRRIVHLAGPRHIRNGYDRLRGYRDALEKFHLEYDTNLVVSGVLSADDGINAMEQILKSGIAFDAVFGFTETALLGAKTALQKHALRIPDDVALCCMSGTALCTLVYPTITAVEQPVEEMATTACRLLKERMTTPDAQPYEVVLRGNIVQREST